MARKRVIRTEEKEEPESQVNGESGRLGSPTKDGGWMAWLEGTYLKYWYVVGCFFIDTLFALELSKAYDGSPVSAVLLLALLLLMAAEVYVYVRIWRRPGRQE